VPRVIIAIFFRSSGLSLGLGCCVLLLGFVVGARGADLETAEKLFLSGQYEQSATNAQAAVAKQPYSDDWQLLLANSLLAQGRYPEALTAVSNALKRGFPSVRVRWCAREVFFSNGRKEDADAMVDAIIQSAGSGRTGEAESLVAIGRAALLKGLDPKLVLDRMFTPAKKFDPSSREVYLAIGDLALEKHDFALAAKTFREGLEKLPDDPDLQYGLAQAYAPSQQTLMIETLEAALQHNSNHVASLLMLADHSIDAEAYTEAIGFLDRSQRVNPSQPEAWAYRSVIATLQNNGSAIEPAKQNAQKFWNTNPSVPYLIGLKLSQKYRFKEGAEFQREALRFDSSYMPAKVQLAQDLLRLGEEANGWQLADEVQKSDNYNITANNLMSLHDTMQQFQVLTNAHFTLRMAPHEAALYGPRALELLEEARTKLSSKYQCTLERTTLVEVFTNQADFGVRTFALPQNDGYLGVCFGNVITANSPGAYPGHPFNWEAMLWHEFCHVITLNLTHNKMPRWLSEGISVYEERQANPAWGEQINPTYREMILNGELTPVSKISAAFLMPPSGEHLLFAYYESSLVVQFLIERFGFAKLQAVLRDLGDGLEINQALAKNTVAMDVLEKDFDAYAKKVAMQLGPGLDWEQPGLVGRKSVRSAHDDKLPLAPPHAPEPAVSAEFDFESWAKTHPTNFYAMMGRAQALVEKKAWSEAKPILLHLIESCPESVGPKSAYGMLAAAHRALGETNEERHVLAKWAGRDDKAADAYSRLIELVRASGDWPEVALNARRLRAVNPLVPVVYRSLAESSEKLGDSRAAVDAYRAVLQLDPSDPAEVHYRMASLLHKSGDSEAHQHVLQALEEAPRYREALRLLLELDKNGTQSQETQKLRTY